MSLWGWKWIGSGGHVAKLVRYANKDRIFDIGNMKKGPREGGPPMICAIPYSLSRCPMNQKRAKISAASTNPVTILVIMPSLPRADTSGMYLNETRGM